MGSSEFWDISIALFLGFSDDELGSFRSLGDTWRELDSREDVSWHGGGVESLFLRVAGERPR